MSQKLSGIKREILIVEDNELNREILASILEEHYDVLQAENGKEGIALLSAHYADLSAVILDVYMPVCNGFEFLEKTQQDSLLASVPVIVATGSDHPEDEIKCLRLGASDFITKPYNPDVVLGRVHSIIKLKESVATLSEVEYDDLTGLYTLPAFCHNVQELLNSEPDTAFNIAVLDLQGFKLVNSVYGEQAGNRVLQYLAEFQQKALPNAILARQSDKFFSCYTDADLSGLEDFSKLLRSMLADAPVPGLVGKVGVCPNIERDVPISILCDRAMLTVATIKSNFAETVALYDEKIQRRLMESRRMENEFDAALEKGEFVAWYQPKVDTQTGKIVAAEALVRWLPTGGGMISPGSFIPLFEQDGLVSRLDEYMFRTVCQFQQKRLQEHKAVVPISINLSRNSIYRPETAEKYAEITDSLGISKALVPIELTESASIDGGEVLELMEHLSKAGFTLHMDDFGSGYSSLSNLTSLPFDVVKLDKSLIDGIGNPKSNIVIYHMVGIARELGMKTVAEGVETAEQVAFLREAGCDMIQGYYFSPPKAQPLFEALLDR